MCARRRRAYCRGAVQTWTRRVNGQSANRTRAASACAWNTQGAPLMSEEPDGDGPPASTARSAAAAAHAHTPRPETRWPRSPIARTSRPAWWSPARGESASAPRLPDHEQEDHEHERGRRVVRGHRERVVEEPPELGGHRVAVLGEAPRQPPGLLRTLSAEPAEEDGKQEQRQRDLQPRLAELLDLVREPEAAAEREDCAGDDQQGADPGDSEQEPDLARSVSPASRLEDDPRHERTAEEEQHAKEV